MRLEKIKFGITTIFSNWIILLFWGCVIGKKKNIALIFEVEYDSLGYFITLLPIG